MFKLYWIACRVGTNSHPIWYEHSLYLLSYVSIDRPLSELSLTKIIISVFYFVGPTITTFRFHLDRETASDKTLLRYMSSL